MAEENHNEEDFTDEQLKDVAQSVPAPDEYPEGQAQELENDIEPENVVDKGVVQGLQATEDASDGTVAKAWDAGVSGIVDGIETIGKKSDASDVLAHHHDTDVTRFAGREYPIPVYTAVFIVLGVITLVEVLLAEIITTNVRIVPLVALSILKAGLVVYYYMHLNVDSRIFAGILILAVIIAGLSAAFLVSVPATGY